jgi:hypothetical protein
MADLIPTAPHAIDVKRRGAKHQAVIFFHTQLLGRVSVVRFLLANVRLPLFLNLSLPQQLLCGALLDPESVVVVVTHDAPLAASRKQQQHSHEKHRGARSLMRSEQSELPPSHCTRHDANSSAVQYTHHTNAPHKRTTQTHH